VQNDVVLTPNVILYSIFARCKFIKTNNSYFKMKFADTEHSKPVVPSRGYPRFGSFDSVPTPFVSLYTYVGAFPRSWNNMSTHSNLNGNSPRSSHTMTLACTHMRTCDFIKIIERDGGSVLCHVSLWVFCPALNGLQFDPVGHSKVSLFLAC
jgi:hypothetical protein